MEKELIFVFLIILLLWLLIKPNRDNTNNNEGFDAKTVEFVPVGNDRYGLRGEKLDTYDIADLYIGPERKIALHPSSEIMWVSDFSPEEELISNCTNVSCPTNENDFDNLDTCYQCGDFKTPITNIPYIHPH